jgi:hypothetical protein
MRTARVCLLGGMCLAMTVFTATAQEQENSKKTPAQKPVPGGDDTDRLPGQRKKLGERNTEAVKVTTLPGGSIMAQLDESFEDALVVTRDADGTLRYTCLHGLETADKHANSPATPVSAAPVLEEK